MCAFIVSLAVALPAPRNLVRPPACSRGQIWMRRPRSKQSQIIDPNVDAEAVFFLSSVGIPDAHIVKVLERRPRVKYLDVERCVRPTFEYLWSSGISAIDIAEAYVRAPLLVGMSVEKVLRPAMEFLQDDVGLPPERSLVVLSMEPALLCHSPAVLRKKMREWAAAGLRKRDVVAEVRANPRRLLDDEVDLEAAAEAYGRLGFQPDSPRLRQLFRRHPDLLFRAFSSAASFAGLLAFFDELHIPAGDRAPIVLHCPALLRASYEHDLAPKVFFLLGWGLSRPQLAFALARSPEAFGAPLHQWHAATALLQETGLDAASVARPARPPGRARGAAGEGAAAAAGGAGDGRRGAAAAPPPARRAHPAPRPRRPAQVRGGDARPGAGRRPPRLPRRPHRLRRRPCRPARAGPSPPGAG